MNPQPITFSLLVRVFQHNAIDLVVSPPAPTGCMYFVGSQKSEAFFPYSSGPVHYLDRVYDGAELIPVKLAHSLCKHLMVSLDRFWKDADALMAQAELPIPVRKTLGQ